MMLLNLLARARTVANWAANTRKREHAARAKALVISRILLLAGGFSTLVVSAAAMADAPANWQIGLPKPQSPLAVEINAFHNNLLVPLIFVISFFVLGLLIYVSYRFSEKRNPTPSKTTHNSLIEILWTVVPVLILVVIAVPSFQLLYKTHTIPESDITLKITGHQWYWTYEYVEDELEFDANLIEEEDLRPGQLRLMTTDNPVVVPTGTNIRLQFIASDVLHAWAVPSLGVRIDAVPGRLNEVWTHVLEPGTYYGFCSELCGVRHSYMPIMVIAIPPDEYDVWSARAKTELALGNDAPLPDSYLYSIEQIETAQSR